MRILITGITGFIGKHLSKRLSEDGHDIFAVIRDSGKKKHFLKQNIECFVENQSTHDLINFFTDNSFDGVIHCASCYMTEHKTDEIEDLINSNILFSTRLLEASVKTGVKWFINTGTFWQHYKNKEYCPVNLYAATKQAFEAIAAYYFQLSEIKFITLKLNDTYGLNDTRPKIFNLWKKICETGESFGMSPGEQCLDMVYIDDVVAAYIKAIALLNNDTEGKYKGQSFVVSSGNHIRLKDLAAIFEKVANKKLNIKWGERPYRKREVMKPWQNGQSVPGWKPETSIEEGIAVILSGKAPTKTN